MLRANVNVSKKLSKDFNSIGYSVSLDAEIMATPDDPESVLERIKELYDLAEEALSQQVDRHLSDSAIAARDADHQPGNNGLSNGHPAPESNGHSSRNGHHDEKPRNNEPASNKQVAFLQTLAKRKKLLGARLEGFINEAIGRRCSPCDLTKKEAGAVIDALNLQEAGDDRSQH